MNINTNKPQQNWLNKWQKGSDDLAIGWCLTDRNNNKVSAVEDTTDKPNKKH